MTPNEIPELDKAGLRRFGLVTGSIIAVLFGGLLPFLFGFNYPLWPWYLAVVLVVWAVLAPASMRGLYRGWMRFGLLLNKITTPILMGLVFFVAVTPTALIMKILGRDAMKRSLDKNIDSYRVPSKKSDKSQLEKPF